VDFVNRTQLGLSADQETGRALEQDDAGEFDSHPPLKARIDALERLNEADEHAKIGEAAAPLLHDPDALARQLAEHVFGRDAISNLARLIAWRRRTCVPEGLAIECPGRSVLARQVHGGRNPRRAGSSARGRSCLENRRGYRGGRGGSAAPRAGALACAIGVLLHEAGWRPDTAPGRPVTLWRDDLSYDPFQAVEALISGWLSADDWASSCKEIGLTGRRLAEPASAASAASGRRATRVNPPSRWAFPRCIGRRPMRSTALTSSEPSRALGDGADPGTRGSPRLPFGVVGPSALCRRVRLAPRPAS